MYSTYNVGGSNVHQTKQVVQSACSTSTVPLGDVRYTHPGRKRGEVYEEDQGD